MVRNAIRAVVALLSAMPMLASGGVVTLTFDALGGGLQNHNLVESGFRISPDCHVDIFNPDGLISGLDAPYPNGNVLGFDSSACQISPNLDYLGVGITLPAEADSAVYIDSSGDAFSFLSFEHDGRPATVLSSKGGMYSIELCGPPAACNTMQLHELSGSDWTGVNWILLAYRSPGAPASLFDNLRFQAVSTVGTMALLLIGFVALGFVGWTANRPVERPSVG